MNCDQHGCSRPAKAQGFCNLHYQRHYAAGTLKRRKTPNGAPLRWIHDHADFSGDTCLTWPFARTSTGYPVISIGRLQTTAHRLMCELTSGEAPTDRHEVAHSCGNGHLGCMNPKHLRWATHVENCDDRRRHGRMKIGELAPNAKLTNADVMAIRNTGAKSPLRVLAEQFGVSPSHICSVLNGRRRVAH